MSLTRPAAILVVVGAMGALLPGAAYGADLSSAGVADAYDAPHHGAFSVDASRGVLANDLVPGLVAELWTEPAYGSVTMQPDGSFAYVRTSVAASDTFVYLATDADGGSTGPVKVTIRFPNTPPSCRPAQARGPDGDGVFAFDLADACTDADGDPLRFVYQRPDVPPGSIWEADAAGRVRFLPPHGWSGTGTVLFAADDGITTSMSAAFVAKVPARDESRDEAEH